MPSRPRIRLIGLTGTADRIAPECLIEFTGMRNKIDDWRKVRQLPARTDQLEKRLSELEKLVGGKVPGETCRKCGTPSMRLQRTIPLPDGITREEWLCQECGLHDKRQIALARR